jgi:hypothetical protein
MAPENCAISSAETLRMGSPVNVWEPQPTGPAWAQRTRGPVAHAEALCWQSPSHVRRTASAGSAGQAIPLDTPQTRMREDAGRAGGVVCRAVRTRVEVCMAKDAGERGRQDRGFNPMRDERLALRQAAASRLPTPAQLSHECSEAQRSANVLGLPCSCCRGSFRAAPVLPC